MKKTHAKVAIQVSTNMSRVSKKLLKFPLKVMVSIAFIFVVVVFSNRNTTLLFIWLASNPIVRKKI